MLKAKKLLFAFYELEQEIGIVHLKVKKNPGQSRSKRQETPTIIPIL